MTKNSLIIDCFAGGGGASVGIEMALGRQVDIAINHDPEAIRMHKVNHPDTLHLTEDIFKVDLKKYVAGRKVALVGSKRLIDEQPTVCTDNNWIPYTEQSKPKKDGIYLVTCDDEEYPVKRMRFKECLWYWTYGIYDGKILAWQPLPAPYKGEEAAD